MKRKSPARASRQAFLPGLRPSGVPLAAVIEAEQVLVAANRQLVERMKKKIRAAIGRVCSEKP